MQDLQLHIWQTFLYKEICGAFKVCILQLRVPWKDVMQVLHFQIKTVSSGHVVKKLLIIATGKFPLWKMPLISHISLMMN